MNERKKEAGIMDANMNPKMKCRVHMLMGTGPGNTLLGTGPLSHTVGTGPLPC